MEQRSRENMEGVRGRPGEELFVEKFGGYKTEVKQRIEERERLALRNKVKEEKHLEIYRGLRADIGMKTYLHGPLDFAKKTKIRVGGLDLRERRQRYTNSLEEEDVATHVYPCGTTIESRTHIGECEMYKEERDALEDEMRKLDECNMEEFGGL